MRNSFVYMRNWVKSEVNELAALIEIISRKDGVEGAKQRTLQRIRKRKETIDKMNNGKFTLKGLFKNAGEKANEVQRMMT